MIAHDVLFYLLIALAIGCVWMAVSGQPFPPRLLLGRSSQAQPPVTSAVTISELGNEYRDSDWPHGLRCADCRRILHDGDRYSTRLYAFNEDAPMCLVVCSSCAAPSDLTPSDRSSTLST